MPGNKIYVQGSYVDVHDNEVVNLSVDKAEVHTQATGKAKKPSEAPAAEVKETKEELFKYIHPTVSEEQEQKIHAEVKRLVASQGIQEICQYLQQMVKEKKILLPQSPSAAYAELVRMGMPQGDGFNESTFRKYYMNK